MNQLLDDLRDANRARQAEWPGADALKGPLATLFRATELCGEVGEAMNNVKKLVREELGIQGSRTTKDATLEEFGDIIISLDLLAAELGIDLIEAVQVKFNKTSNEQGLKTKLDGMY